MDEEVRGAICVLPMYKNHNTCKQQQFDEQNCAQLQAIRLYFIHDRNLSRIVM